MIEPLPSATNPLETSGDEALVALIRAEIAAAGPLTFARYMGLALLHPDHGYYAIRPAIGRGGDFVTSPELHAAFGACLATQAAEIWRALGRPADFTVLEWGAGSGALARDLLVAARADTAFAAVMRYAIHEVSPVLIGHQQVRLADEPAVTWTDAATPRTGLVLANEVLDAMPVHRVTWRAGRLMELLVDWRDDRLTEVAASPTTPALAAYLAEGGVTLAEGQVAEINLVALDWLAAVATHLEHGAVIVIDYGDTTAGLYGPARRRGTLLCYSHQTVNEEPFARVGQQDITAHVDFGALMRQAERLGFQVAGFTTQGAFLAGLGLDTILADLQARLPGIAYVQQRQAIADLIRPDRLGRFRVLVLTRGLAPDTPWAGLSLRL